MPEQAVLSAVALACLVAAAVWGVSARRMHRALQRIDDGTGSDAAELARGAFRRELHTTVLYLLLAAGVGLQAALGGDATAWLAIFLVVPLVVTAQHAARFRREARLAEGRSQLERRAEEVLSQDELAPRRWAARLAPEALPVVGGFEVGTVYEAGTGLMAGDFYDLYRTGPARIAAVIGDVSGHGIEPSITAFQAKYLLRVFLREFRDPAQAVEELNVTLSGEGGPEEFISLAVVLFDTDAETLRYASAGHPAAWLWHDREARPLRSTGPVLTLDPGVTYTSREIPLDRGDLAVLYTDGLSEARRGAELFGEDRIAAVIRRDPTVSPQQLCWALLDAAREFADQEISDDIAILAVRKV